MKTPCSCNHLRCFKIKLISELVSVATIGFLYELWSNGQYLKWHSQGREAFLIYQSQRFDKFYANPHYTLLWILSYVVLAMLVFALYKGIAFVVAKTLSAFFDENEIA
jgi:hypothetical protein